MEQLAHTLHNTKANERAPSHWRPPTSVGGGRTHWPKLAEMCVCVCVRRRICWDLFRFGWDLFRCVQIAWLAGQRLILGRTHHDELAGWLATNSLAGGGCQRERRLFEWLLGAANACQWRARSLASIEPEMKPPPANANTIAYCVLCIVLGLCFKSACLLPVAQANDRQTDEQRESPSLNPILTSNSFRFDSVGLSCSFVCSCICCVIMFKSGR